MKRRLLVNPVKCEGFGVCAELFPERVKLDEWGFPVVDGRPIGPDILEHAERAIRECPTAALMLVNVEE
jgi:ferredoxin